MDYRHSGAADYGYSMIDRTHLVSFVYGSAFILEAAAIIAVAAVSLFRRSAWRRHSLPPS